MEDIRILGAGPAGLTAAICLAKSGVRVRVIERRKDCGLRFRGDLQGIENWSSNCDVFVQLQAMQIEPTFLQPFSTVFETNGQRTARLDLQRPAFYVVKRGAENDSLDQSLKRQAVEAGVRIDFQSVMPPSEVDIVATGPVAGMIPAIAKGITFNTERPNLAVGVLSNDLTSRGYGYLLIAGGRGCLATVLFNDFSRADAYLSRLRDFVGRQFGIYPRDVHPMGGVGHFSVHKRFQRGSTMFAGEAAGLQDLLWGFGIRTAMRSGHLAAQCFLTGASYAALARKQFCDLQQATIANRFLWEILSVGRYRLLMALLERYNLPLLRSFHGFNRFQQILYPISLYWIRFRYPQICKEYGYKGQ